MHDESTKYPVPAEPGYLSFHRFRCGFCGVPFDKEPEFVTHVQGHHRTRKRVKTTDALPKAKVEPIQRHPESHSTAGAVVVNDGKRKKHLSDSLIGAKFTPVQGNIFSRIRVKTDDVRFGDGCKTSLKTEISPVNKSISPEPEDKSHEGSMKEELLHQGLDPGDISCSSQEEPVSGTVPKSPRVRKSLYEKMEEASVLKRKIFKLTPSSIAFLHSDLFDSHSKSLRYALCKKQSPSAAGTAPSQEEEELLNCAECHFIAKNSDDLLSHMTTLHSSSIAQLQKNLSNFHDCQEADCHFRAQTKEALVMHVRVLHSGEPSDSPPISRFHDCPQCCFRAKDQASLVAHGRVLHGESPDTASTSSSSHSESSQTTYNCQYCSFSAIDENTLEDHIMSEHLAPPEPGLPAHVPAKPPYQGGKSEDKLFCCGICDSYYSYSHHHIVRHIQAGCNSEFYKCPDCDYSATKSTHLTRHLQKVHPELL